MSCAFTLSSYQRVTDPLYWVARRLRPAAATRLATLCFRCRRAEPDRISSHSAGCPIADRKRLPDRSRGVHRRDAGDLADATWRRIALSSLRCHRGRGRGGAGRLFPLARRKPGAFQEIFRFAAQGTVGSRRVPAFKELTSSAAYYLSGFHDAVLRNGPLPLDLLDEVVDAWIAELK